MLYVSLGVADDVNETEMLTPAAIWARRASPCPRVIPMVGTKGLAASGKTCREYPSSVPSALFVAMTAEAPCEAASWTLMPKEQVPRSIRATFPVRGSGKSA